MPLQVPTSQPTRRNCVFLDGKGALLEGNSHLDTSNLVTLGPGDIASSPQNRRIYPNEGGRPRNGTQPCSPTTAHTPTWRSTTASADLPTPWTPEIQQKTTPLRLYCISGFSSGLGLNVPQFANLRVSTPSFSLACAPLGTTTSAAEYSRLQQPHLRSEPDPWFHAVISRSPRFPTKSANRSRGRTDIEARILFALCGFLERRLYGEE